MHYLKKSILYFLLLVTPVLLASCDDTTEDDDYDDYYESDEDDDDYSGYSDDDDTDNNDDDNENIDDTSDDDDSGIDIDISWCDDAPGTCHSQNSAINSITFHINPSENDNNIVYVELYEGELSSLDERPEPYATFEFSTPTATYDVPKGIYSAKAFYTIGGEEVVAIDGIKMIPEKNVYCDTTCWEGDSQILYLDVDLDAIRKYRNQNDENCFIATAAWGKNSAYVNVLRVFRDNVLLQSAPGRMFVKYYYMFSPPIAKLVASSPILSTIVRGLLYPVVFFVIHPYALFLFVPGIPLFTVALINIHRKRKNV
jgi:hypothetical protein